MLPSVPSENPCVEGNEGVTAEGSGRVKRTAFFCAERKVLGETLQQVHVGQFISGV